MHLSLYIFLNIDAVMKRKVEAICTVLTVKNLHFGFTSSKHLGMLTSELYILCILIILRREYYCSSYGISGEERLIKGQHYFRNDLTPL